MQNDTLCTLVVCVDNIMQNTRCRILSNSGLDIKIKVIVSNKNFQYSRNTNEEQYMSKIEI